MWTFGGVMLLQLWWFRGFSFASFDRVTARVHGLPVRLLTAVAFVVVAAIFRLVVSVGIRLVRRRA